MNKKHLLIINNQDIYNITTPKKMSKRESKKFPDFNFINSDNTSTDIQIEKILTQVSRLPLNY